MLHQSACPVGALKWMFRAILGTVLLPYYSIYDYYKFPKSMLTSRHLLKRVCIVAERIVSFLDALIYVFLSLVSKKSVALAPLGAYA